MRRTLLITLALALLSAACSGNSSNNATNQTPGLTDPTTAAVADTADQIANDYNRSLDDWVAAIDTATDGLTDYPKQIQVKQNTAAELSTQKTDCSAASSAATKANTPPVLDKPPSGATSAAYETAVAKDKSIRAAAKAVQTELTAIVRFCTWLNTFESGQPAANAANASLFSQPLRYTGTIKVNGVSHTCAKGSSCYTPDQSLWPRITQLLQQQGSASAQGAAAINKDHIPCLVKGWDAACKLVVQNQLDYQTWTDEYAKAFDDNKKKDLPTANAAISAVAAKFDREVLYPLSNLPGIYKQLAPKQKYDSRVSTTGANIWIAEVTDQVKALKAAVAKL